MAIDRAGHPIPETAPALAAVFADRRHEELAVLADALLQGVRGLLVGTWDKFLPAEALRKAEELRDLLMDAAPYAVCERCGGTGAACAACRTGGYVTRSLYDRTRAGDSGHFKARRSGVTPGPAC